MGNCQRADDAVQQTLVAHGADPGSANFATGHGVVTVGAAIAAPEAAAEEAAGAAADDTAATLQAAVNQWASQVVATQSIRARGPVLTGAMDYADG